MRTSVQATYQTSDVLTPSVPFADAHAKLHGETVPLLIITFFI